MFSKYIWFEMMQHVLKLMVLEWKPVKTHETQWKQMHCTHWRPHGPKTLKSVSVSIIFCCHRESGLPWGRLRPPWPPPPPCNRSYGFWKNNFPYLCIYTICVHVNAYIHACMLIYMYLHTCTPHMNLAAIAILYIHLHLSVTTYRLCVPYCTD